MTKRKGRTYLGHPISGSSHGGWRAYAGGKDIYSPTLEGIKDKIHLEERGFRRTHIRK